MSKDSKERIGIAGIDIDVASLAKFLAQLEREKLIRINRRKLKLKQ